MAKEIYYPNPEFSKNARIKKLMGGVNLGSLSKN